MIAPIVFVLAGAWMVFWAGGGLAVAEARQLRTRWLWLRFALGVALLFAAIYVAADYRL